MLKRRLSVAAFVAVLLLPSCGEEKPAPTAPDPAELQKIAAAEEARIACAETGVASHAKQGIAYVDNWFSQDVVTLWGDPYNANRAILAPTCGYPDSASWTHLEDSLSIACSIFGSFDTLRASYRCLGEGLTVVMLKHNGFSGSAAYFVSKFGLTPSSGPTREDVLGLLDAARREGVEAEVLAALRDFRRVELARRGFSSVTLAGVK